MSHNASLQSAPASGILNHENSRLKHWEINKLRVGVSRALHNRLRLASEKIKQGNVSDAVIYDSYFLN